MTRHTPESTGATSVIVHDVHTEHRSDYERWMERAVEAHRKFPGYLATDVIKPVDSFLRYVVVLRFTSEEYANDWLVSDIRKKLLAESLPWLVTTDRYEVRATSEFWFQPADGKNQPKRWKQWLLSTAAVFPLTLLVPSLVGMVLNLSGLVLVPQLIRHAFVASLISAVMVYWLMPFLSKVAKTWLLR